MQYGNGDDEGQEELVGNIDMMFFVVQDCVKEYDQIVDLNNCQLNINILFWFCIFFGLSCVQKVFGGGQYDEQLVFLEYKLYQVVIKQVYLRGLLYDVEICSQ